MRRFLPHGLMAFLVFATTPGAYAQTYSFNSCGATGKNGPAQANVNSSYGTGNTLNGNVTIINNGIQQWTVPATGSYRIALAGASGGASAFSAGGSGIAIQSDISLVAGQVLNVVVGQSGQSNASTSQFFTGGSGGGGSFIYSGSIGGGNLLLAAGGGGGGLSSQTNVVASNISNGNFNTNGYTITDAGNNIAAGGINGNGGGFSGRPILSGGPGTGWLSDFNSSFANGYTLLGGTRFTGGTANAAGRDGGFGGGGASGDNSGNPYGWAGGGGGYSGGAGGHNGGNSDGQAGGGGGSFLTGSNQTNLGFNNGPGYVTLSFKAISAGALHFDGSNDHIKIPDHPNLRLSGGSFSVEFWAKPTLVDGQARWVISKGNGNADIDYQVGIDVSNKWHFVSRNGNIDISGGEVVVPDTYYHIACTFDGSVANLLINGVVAGSSNTAGSPVTGSADLVIGGRNALAINQVFGGDIDELRIWNRALCAGELSHYRNCEPGNIPPGLVAYYKLNNGFINTINTGVINATDASGNNNHGTLTGFALNGNSSNWVTGKVNGTCTAFVPPTATITVMGATTFCAGGSVTLTASAGSSYLWSNNATTQSVNITAAGNYSVTVVNAEGCAATSTAVAVGVNPLPVVSIALSGATEFCPVSSVTLAATAGSSYAWSNGAVTQTIDVNTSGNYTVRVTNENGCVATSGITAITVQDIIPPTIIAPASITVNLTNGSCSTMGIILGTPTTADNCGIASITNNAPATYPMGTTIVLWTVTDNSNRTATATQNVTVTAPAINISGNNIAINSGDITPSVTDHTDMGTTLPGVSINKTYTLQNTGSSDLIISSIAVSGANATDFLVSGIVLPLTITANNTANFVMTFSSVTIGVRNEIVIVNSNDCSTPPYSFSIAAAVTCAAPVFTICSDNITTGTGLNTCVATVNYIATVSGSPVPLIAYTFSGATTGTGPGTGSGSTFNKGTTTVVITAENPCGTVSCTFSVTVSDNGIPSITAPADVVVQTDPASSVATNVGLGSPATADNCQVANVYNNAPQSYPIGTTIVTWAVNDDAGNTGMANQKVTVVDSVMPVILGLPAAIIQGNDLGTCSGRVSWSPVTAIDNAPGVTLTSDHQSGELFPIGTTTVTYHATDASGNIVIASFTIQIRDTEKPLLAGISANLNTDCTKIPTVPSVTATDNCDPAPVITLLESNTQNTDVNTLGYYNYSISRKWTATDAAGNVETATQLISVTDNTAPVLNLPSAINITNDTDACGATVSFIVTATDDCKGLVTIKYSQAPGTVFVVGTTTVMVTATDLSGNTSKGSFTVTVRDNQKPALTAPANVLIFTDRGVCVATQVVLGNASTADNCGVNLATHNAPASFPVGITTITWTVTDIHGNTATATQTVTVTDNEKPIIQAPGEFSMPTDAGTCGAIIKNLGTPVTTDNCGVALVSNDHPASYFPVGTTIVSWTVTDIHGNITDTAKQIINVIDNELPTISSANIHVNNAIGVCGATVDLGTPTANDNCGIASVTNDHPSAFFPIGTTNVMWTVTDNKGWRKTSIQTVTVVDVEKPLVRTKQLTVYLDATGFAMITAAQINDGSSDNCSIATMVLDKTNFSCSNLGGNTVTLTVTDVNGNSELKTAIVTVVDISKPVVVTKNITVYLDAMGFATVTAAQLNDGSTDNCSIATMVLDKASFSCSNLGENTVLLTVTDGSGNTSTKTATLTVQDNIAPLITPVANQSFCTNAVAIYTIPVLTVFDNCGIASVIYTITGATSRSGIGVNASGVFNNGTSTVSWIVTDTKGNFTNSSTTVTITPLPAAIISVSNADAFCNKLVLTASSADAGATYRWMSDTSLYANTRQINLGQANGDGVYSVSVTVNGCTSAVANYQFLKQNMVASYTILAFEGVALGENNTVASGSVGVMSPSGKASFRSNSSVVSPGSFVKAKYIEKKGSNIKIANPIYSPAKDISLPVMFYNTAYTHNLRSTFVNENVTTTLNGNYKNLTLKKGSNTTLTGNTFGNIKIERGAQVKFTAVTINIDKLKIDKGPRNGYSYIRFAPNTKVLVSTSVSIGSQVYVNPDNNQVSFYMGDKHCDEEKFSVKGGDTRVNVNVFAPKGKLKVTGGYRYGDYGRGYGDCDRDDDDDRFLGQGNHYVYMTGLFIAEEVEGNGKNVIWNSFDCSAAPVAGVNNTLITQSISEEKVISNEELKITVMPNPTTTHFTIKLESKYETPVSMRVMDANGRVVDARAKLGANSTIPIGHNYSSGMYYAEMIQGTTRKVVQLVKVRR